MSKGKQKQQEYDIAYSLLQIVIGIQILYAGYRVLNILLFAFVSDIEILPIILFNLGIYTLFIYIGISYFRQKKYGWLGEASLYLILLIQNITKIIGYIAIQFIKESLFTNMPQQVKAMKIIFIWAIIEFILYGIVLKLLFRHGTIERFNFRNSSRRSLFIKGSIIVIVALAIYFGVGDVIRK